jgi:hypothetical protein
MERIEALEQQHRDLLAGFRVHYGHHAPKELEREQRSFFAKLARGDAAPVLVNTAGLLDEMFSLGARLSKKVS